MRVPPFLSAQSAELAGPTSPDDKCAPGGDKKESRIVQLRLVRATIPDWEWMRKAHASQGERLDSLAARNPKAERNQFEFDDLKGTTGLTPRHEPNYP